MGLLDAFNSPEMALAAGLLGGGNFGQALGRGMAGAQAVQLAEQRRREMEAQAEERRAMAEQRQAQMQLAQQKQARIQSILSGAQQQGISPGAFRPSIDGSGPTMPASMAGQARNPGGVLSNLSPDQIMALKMDGIDVFDQWKYQNEPQERKAGSFYQTPGGQREYIGDPTKGLTMNNGAIARMPGSENIAGLAGDVTRAQEQAKAGLDLVDIPMSDGTTRKVPRAQAVQQLGGGQPTRQTQSQPGVTGSGYAGGDRDSANADSIKVMERELQNPNLSAQDKAGIQREIARLQRQSGFGVTRSPEETARATKQAEADVTRSEGNVTKGTKANELLSGAQRARELLSKSPTESLVGAGVDKLGSIVGYSPRGADVASQLEALSGWMVSNVPRMEGPQSNFDVANYQTMAGKVGDKTLPVSQRLSALTEVENLQKKYADMNNIPINPKATSGASGSWGESAKPQKKTISLADITETARKSGKTTAEVTAAARAKGYEIGGN